MTGIVNDRINRLEGERGRLHLIDELDDSFLEWHRDATTADAEGAKAMDGCLEVGGGEGFVDEVQAEFAVKEVVEPSAEIARAPGKRHAEFCFLVDVHARVSTFRRNLRAPNSVRTFSFSISHSHSIPPLSPIVILLLLLAPSRLKECEDDASDNKSERPGEIDVEPGGLQDR